MKSHLKVKVVTLSAEMTYIRRQEIKWKKRAKYARQKQLSNEAMERYADKVRYALDNFWSQRQHRHELKLEARTSHLAYGCMRGVPYREMEHICYGQMNGYGSREPDWDNIMATVERFAKGEPRKSEIMQRAEEWLSEAKLWYEGNTHRIAWATSSRDHIYEDMKSNLDYQNALFNWKKIAKANAIDGIKIPQRPKYEG